MAAELAMPFEGLAVGWQILFTICLVVVVAMFVWSAVLFVRARRAIRKPPRADEGAANAFTWVFLVPALNEAVTIRDSVDRLLSLELESRRVIVIDDGSDDGTGEILAAIDHPDLHVITRVAPAARQGKAAALNHAYQSLRNFPNRDRTIVAIVDADGRLRADAPRFAASHFEDPEVGGVQSLVRIYNRGHLLTWLQDVEFAIYGHLFQAGRVAWGTAGMGGNGQFNRLSALDDVCDHAGPWRDRLTEDQDLGLRLLAAGWRGHQDLRATVDQQGLSSLRPLLRQRTRWSQGNLQSMGLGPEVWHSPFPLAARIEQMIYLFMPFWQGIVGIGLLAAIVLWATGEAGFWGASLGWQIAFFYLLAFGGTIMGAIASRSADGPAGYVTGFLIGQIYVPYTWLIWPVLLRSTARQLTERREWAKTEREPLEDKAAI